MNNLEELVGIKTRFENCSETDLKSYLYSFQNKWINPGNISINLLVTKATENFGLSENFTYSELN